MNLITELHNEIIRNLKLVELYKEFPNGTFAAVMIAQDIKAAEQALADGDTIAMISALKTLKDNGE